VLRSFGELYESAHDLNLAEVARGFRADLAQWAWAALIAIAASQSSANQWYLKRQVELLFHTDSYGYLPGRSALGRGRHKPGTLLGVLWEPE
jgi:hypothetical protein